MHQCGDLQVVETDEGDILRDSQAHIESSFDHAEGHVVICGRDGRNFAEVPEKCFRHVIPSGESVRPMHDRSFGAMTKLSYRLNEPMCPIGEIRVLLRAGEMDKVAMAMRQQALRSKLPAAAVVGADGGKGSSFDWAVE